MQSELQCYWYTSLVFLLENCREQFCANNKN